MIITCINVNLISSLAVVLIHRYRTCCLIDGIHPRYFTVCSCCACCTNSITIQRKTTYPQSAVAGWAGNDIFAHLIIGNLFLRCQIFCKSTKWRIRCSLTCCQTNTKIIILIVFCHCYSYRSQYSICISLHMKCNCYCLLFLLVCRLTCLYINAGKQ